MSNPDRQLSSTKIVRSQWTVGDLAYRKQYEGRVVPTNVFRVKEVAGNKLKVNYSLASANWTFPNDTNLEHTWRADDCIHISEEEYRALIETFEN